MDESILCKGRDFWGFGSIRSIPTSDVANRMGHVVLSCWYHSGWSDTCEPKPAHTKKLTLHVGSRVRALWRTPGDLHCNIEALRCTTSGWTGGWGDRQRGSD